MSRDGAGTYNLPPGNPVVTETVISSTTHNTTMADVASALTQSLARDGQTTMTGNQSMGGFRHTQVADATARNQYATAAQVQDGNLTLVTAVSGTNVITGSISPAISAYATGVFLTLIPTGNNTGAVTLALNGLAARPVVKFNNVPLVAGDLLTGVPATLIYNGTNFYLENPQVVASDVVRLTQANNFTSNNTFSVTGTAAAPSVHLTSVFPLLGLTNTAAPVDNRSWLNYVTTGGAWVLASDNDAHTTASTLITATKTALALTATTITVNGVNVGDFSRLSTTNTFLVSQVVGSGTSAVSLTVNSNTLTASPEMLILNNSVAGTHASRMISFRRNGGQVASFDMTATTLSLDTGINSFLLNGVNVRDAALFSTGTLANARVSQANVTQHQASLSIGGRQIISTVNDIISSVAVTDTHTGNINIVSNASTITLTVGVNALGNNGQAALYIRRGAGAVNFSASGTTIRSPGGGLGIAIVNGKVGLIQVSTTEYELCGNVA